MQKTLDILKGAVLVMLTLVAGSASTLKIKGITDTPVPTPMPVAPNA